MDEDTLGDYWRDVSPILKQQAKEKRKIQLCFRWDGLYNKTAKG